MAEDMWANDPHPAVATVERALSDAGARFLYGTHLQVHQALDLPAVPLEAVQAAYRTGQLPLAKAYSDEQRRSGSKAAALFEQLRHEVSGARKVRDVVEATCENWYAHGLIEDQARVAGVKANLLGLVQAQDAVPGGAASVPALRSGITDPDALHAVDWSAEHAAELMRGLKDRTRGLIAGAVLDAGLSGESAQLLAVRLNSLYGTLNRDWRRVAITEVAFARAHGYLSGLQDGERVEWKAATDACGMCAGLDGQVFTVRRAPGDWQREVWPGKTNAGRAFAAKKRDGSARSDEERAAPCIPLHPNCRCRWLRVAPRIAGVSPALEAYLAQLARS